jgi:hypothetical protein
MRIDKRMTKYFASIVALMLSVTTLYGWGSDYVPLVEGTLTFTFQPQDSGGTDGTWQAVIITPDGERISGDAVAYSVTDPYVMEVSCVSSGFTEVGSYGVELKNNIVDSATPFLSSITVECNCPTLSWDTISYKNMPTSSNGENTVMYYVVPAEVLY